MLAGCILFFSLKAGDFSALEGHFYVLTNMKRKNLDRYLIFFTNEESAIQLGKTKICVNKSEYSL